MTTIRNLMGTGSSPLNAQASATGILSNSLTAAGNSQGTALAAPSDFMVFTTVSASTGVILPANPGAQPGDYYTIVNHGAQTLSVYPPSGGKIANGSANAAFSVLSTKTAFLVCIDGTNWAAATSA
jgi:hypothetical protein